MVSMSSRGGVLVVWIWTDELARMLISAGLVEEATVRSWIERPTAIPLLAESEPERVSDPVAEEERQLGAA